MTNSIVGYAFIFVGLVNLVTIVAGVFFSFPWEMPLEYTFAFAIICMLGGGIGIIILTLADIQEKLSKLDETRVFK
jgi:pilus assembly protein TadC